MLFLPRTSSFLLGCFTAFLGGSYSVVVRTPLRVETFVHQDVSVNMVSSLIIGSQAAMLIDLPLTISSAKNLTAWVKSKTSNPVVAAFTTHNHPDHYLSARVILDAFPTATFYANSEASAGIAIAAPGISAVFTAVFGTSEVVQNVSIPITFPFSFFALPGDSDYPIHLIQPLTGDTVDTTLFWIPSLRTLIAGDSVFGAKLHLYLADMMTPTLTASWISTLDFLLSLKPAVVIPGHSLPSDSFTGVKNIQSTRQYLSFWQSEVEAKGPDFYTPQDLYEIMISAFPGYNDSTSEQFLNITVENFGRGGIPFRHSQDFTVYNNLEELNEWEL
ncbi:beta-lactamase-like protein [Leptodontidium sp. 2 PMI_412]|nr:beta-lactamase-like protein [Leptodontidium sp. 2 PMI_412]